jgi:type IV pilus assembly protein PilB
MDPAQASTASNQVSRDSLEGILLADGVISKDQFDKVRLESVSSGFPAEQLILQHNYAPESAVFKAKSELSGIPYAEISQLGVSPEAMNLIPESVAKRYQVLPFALDKENRILSVAMANPSDLVTSDFIEAKAGMKIQPYMAPPLELKEAIDVRYTESLSGEVTAALKETGAVQSGVKTLDSRSIGEVIKEAPIAKIVSTVLEFAIKARASDVHIEPGEDRTRIRYRIDGILQEKLILPRSVHDAVVSRIKILSDMKIDEKRIPQDGRFNFRSGEEEVDLRVSSLPTVHGEKIVMRLLKKTGKVPSLPELGLRGRALKDLQTAILVPHGIVLITGPTGSGKTTTLYSILTNINTPKVNIVTLEDPVEYQMAGVNQVQINPQAGLTFASGLRSFLRQDPNIIMVGEVRDEETADLAIQAALTGHLVFSTLHTNDAAGALPRMLDMKVEPYLLASSITAVMAQRVVRKVCPDCKGSYVPEGPVLEDFKRVLGNMFTGWLQSHPEAVAEAKKLNGEIALYHSVDPSCKTCGGTGYFGRMGIFEVMPVSNKIGKLVMERAAASLVQQEAVVEGMILMKQDGYLKALEGITTIEEVLRVAQI